MKKLGNWNRLIVGIIHKSLVETIKSYKIRQLKTLGNWSRFKRILLKKDWRHSALNPRFMWRRLTNLLLKRHYHK